MVLTGAFEIVELEERLWQRARMMNEGSAKLNTACALVGFDDGSLASILECLRLVFSGGDVLVLTADRLGSGFPSEQIDLMICFVDGYKDTSSAVNDLLEFRRNYPTARILIISREFGGDDMGEHRRVICDASLRWPITERRLASAIEFAFDQAAWRGI